LLFGVYTGFRRHPESGCDRGLDSLESPGDEVRWAQPLDGVVEMGKKLVVLRLGASTAPGE